MNKTIILTVVLTLMGGMIFAGGGADTSYNNRQGFNQAQEWEIISLKGDVVTDSYGNPMVSQGGKNYLISVAPTLDFDLTDASSIEGEGVIGRTVYTKNGKDYMEFHLTLVVVDGETKTVDLNRMQGYGSNMMGYQGRMDRSNMPGSTRRPGSAARDSFHNDDQRGFFDKNNLDDRGFMGRDSDWDDRGPMGMGFTDFQGEEKTLSGKITLYNEEYPMISSSEGKYVLMMGRFNYDDVDWKEGMTIEATGFTGRTLYSDEGEDYYTFMVSTAVVDGKEVEFDHLSMNGEDGFRGSMMGRGQSSRGDWSRNDNSFRR
jgi:hypothetical protein